MIQERVKALRKHFDLSQAEFGKQLGVSRDVISNLEYGRVAVSDLIINMICAKFGVNEKWLRTGEGEMFPKPDTDPLWGMLGEVLKEEKSSFRRQLITALCQLELDEIAVCEKIFDKFLAEREKAKKEEEG